MVEPRVVAFLAGDRSAGEQLLLEVLPRVRNVIRVLVGPDRDVDDIAQIVMVNVIGSLPGYRGEAPLFAWVDRITARTTLGHVKKRRSKEHVESNFEEERPSVAEMSSHRTLSSDGHVDVRKVLGYLDELPEEQRQAVVLHHALGYTIQQAAEQQGVSAETLRSRLRLAVNRLREKCTPGSAAHAEDPVERTWSAPALAESALPSGTEQEQP